MIIVKMVVTAKGGVGMKAQGLERLETMCGFFMPKTVLTGGDGCLLVIVIKQQVNGDVYWPSSTGG